MKEHNYFYLLLYVPKHYVENEFIFWQKNWIFIYKIILHTHLSTMDSTTHVSFENYFSETWCHTWVITLSDYLFCPLLDSNEENAKGFFCTWNIYVRKSIALIFKKFPHLRANRYHTPQYSPRARKINYNISSFLLCNVYHRERVECLILGASERLGILRLIFEECQGEFLNEKNYVHPGHQKGVSRFNK